MVNTINMEDLRHLNLFAKVTRIQTRYCFSYNDILMFCVPKAQISKALGNRGENLKKISDVLRKRIRILPIPRGIEDANAFIQSIVNPVTFKEINITPDEIIMNAGPQSKASLLGRNKRRLAEMQEIVKGFFGLGYRVI